uniref:Protein CWC15 homolog n=1 Tax=Caenorhabditis japonica TaxID=281687 RepID=A0A8R1HGP0_CAEJA
MTTAHRPTFYPARGGTARGEGDLSKLSNQYSSKDMPSHTKMKYRQSGQETIDDIRKKDLRRELEDKERNAAREKRARDSATSSSSSTHTKRQRMDQIAAESAVAVDADEAVDELNSSEDEDSDDDDTAALMAELEKIKKERAEEKAAREEVAKEEAEKQRMANILSGNPLLNETPSASASTTGGDFTVKRRWDDDVVFKNCAKGIEERKKEVTFINDAIRSEFHKKFMDKYIK